MDDEKRLALSNLRARMRRAGLKQYVLAERLERDPGTISKILAGKIQGMGVDQQVVLAQMLGCHISDLFAPLPNGKGPSSPHAVKLVPVLHPSVIDSIDRDTLATVLLSWRGKRLFVPEADATQFVVEQTDDSMARVAAPGSCLLIDPDQTEIVSGQLYLIRRDGQVMARRAAGEGERRRFEAETLASPMPDPIYLDSDPAPEIIGRVQGIYTKA